MATTNNSSADPRDFSEPWKFSDVVLVVEEQRFHVHRSTLSMWSPVFEKMFTSDFKEKNSGEIPLPGKKASEIRELLQIMYPSLEEKVVTKGNCYFLLDLAREYQITSITQKCENFLDTAVKTRNENDVLASLVIGQEYELKTLIKTCAYEARRLSLEQLKEHSKRAEIEPDNYMQITEEIIARLEEQCQLVKASSLKGLNDVSKLLYYHAKEKGQFKYNPWRREPGWNETTSRYLAELKADKPSSLTGICPSLTDVADYLKKLNDTIETLP